MPDEVFEQSLRRCLDGHLRRHPAAQAEDALKFVFQAMLGPGHLISSRETAEEYIAREEAGLTPDPSEPLTEELSPAWCRLNLRRAMAEGLTPRVISGLMTASFPAPAFTRQDVLDCCARIVPPGGRFADVLSADWLPSHSEKYHEAYRPAYRVIPAGWIPCLPAVIETAGKLSALPRVLLTVDGPCASGKTTLALRLAEVFGAFAAHTDDYVVPHARKTAERLAVPGGNCDWERLSEELIVPWKRGTKTVYRRYDCAADRFAPGGPVPPDGLMILEGSCCNLPAIRACADVRVFLTAPESVRRARLERRESPESLQRFDTLWIPLENAYFEAFRLPDAGCFLIR